MTHSTTGLHDYIVPGLDVLIGDPDFLRPTRDTRPKAKRIFLPEGYIYRIDDFHKEQSSRGEASRELQTIFSRHILREIHESGEPLYRFPNGMELEIVPIDSCKFPGRLDPRSSKSQAIAVAQYVLDSNNILCDNPSVNATNLAIMTGSDSLANLAYLHSFDVAMLNPDVYTGRRKLALPAEVSALWFSNHRINPAEWHDIFPDEAPLRPNEFVEFTGDYLERNDHFYRNIGRCDPETGTLLPLRYREFTKGNLAQRIFSRTAGQAMVIEALLAPVEEIPIVVISGIFGTGKTFLSVAAGYFRTIQNEYDQIFVCPRDSRLGDDIGFLPGGSTDKTRPKAKPIEDNFLQVLKLQYADERDGKGNTGRGSAYDQYERLIKDHIIEFEPVIQMGGRSISDSFIIYDEFQDMERYQVKALLSRPADGSKMVILGDPTQTSNPHLNTTSNGLAYAASKLAGKPEAAVVSLVKQEIIRSRAARAIAEYFS